MKPASFSVSRHDHDLIVRAVKRTEALYAAEGLDPPDDRMSRVMDLTACHANGCELNLVKLLDFDDFNFLHDITGIRRHINRETGKIEDCFLPRCAR